MQQKSKLMCKMNHKHPARSTRMGPSKYGSQYSQRCLRQHCPPATSAALLTQIHGDFSVSLASTLRFWLIRSVYRMATAGDFCSREAYHLQPECGQ